MRPVVRLLAYPQNVKRAVVFSEPLLCLLVAVFLFQFHNFSFQHRFSLFFVIDGFLSFCHADRQVSFCRGP